ncbi:MAG: matrixin family metalloprotease [Deltaproteobacteria bacterium]|nr:matrixin family metalloprotease [Deltaproteobacteria bacterium]
MFCRTQEARAQSSATSNDFYEVAALKARIYATLSAESREQRAASAPLPLQPLPSGVAIDDQEDFVLINFPPIRWFEPDSGSPVVMALNPTNVFPTGEEQLDAGLLAWNTARQSTFRFTKGVTTTSKGFSADGVNAASFNDPSGQLPDPVNCTGVLAAVSYVTVSDESRTLHEQTFARLLEADLVFANGWDNCVAFKSPSNIAEVVTHELGHVLGLGHSTNPEATMFFRAHFDGRGATLHPDDESGAAFLYPDASFPPCTYSISPGKRSQGSVAASAKISVSTRDGCGWVAASTVPWITITEGASSSGKGQVIYTVGGHSEKTARRGAILVAGKTFTVTQKGVSTRKGIPKFFAR